MHPPCGPSTHAGGGTWNRRGRHSPSLPLTDSDRQRRLPRPRCKRVLLPAVQSSVLNGSWRVDGLFFFRVLRNVLTRAPCVCVVQGTKFDMRGVQLALGPASEFAVQYHAKRGGGGLSWFRQLSHVYFGPASAWGVRRACGEANGVYFPAHGGSNGSLFWRSKRDWGFRCLWETDRNCGCSFNVLSTSR